MFKKTKIALAAVLLAGTATAASAQAFASNVHEFQSAPARLRSDGAFVPDATRFLRRTTGLLPTSLIVRLLPTRAAVANKLTVPISQNSACSAGLH